MTSAKVTFKQQDRSAIVPTLKGIYAGIVVVCNKGPIGKPVLITSVNQMLERFGNPNPKLGTAFYSALTYLKQGNKLWVVRAAHSDAKYAASLVRTKINPIPSEATGAINNDNLVVCPVVGGLTQAELDSYIFPSYITNKLYAKQAISVFEEASASDEVRVNTFEGLQVGDSISFSKLTLDVLNSSTTKVGEDLLTLQVVDLRQEKVNYDNLTLVTPMTVKKGDVVKKVVNGVTSDYPGGPVTVLRAATNSTNILVSNSDYIAHEDTIQIGSAISDVDAKVFHVEDANIIKLDGKVTTTTADFIYKVVQSEFEDRDALLIVSESQGEHGNRTSYSITSSANYKNAFNIVVYYDGTQVETWEVTRDRQIDGFQRQLQAEQKINGKSKYIRVLNNSALVDSDGAMQAPLETSYSLWRQNPDDIFVPTTSLLIENLLKGHVEVKASAVTDLKLGDRIKFVVGNNNTLSKEYKILSLDATKKTFILDRGIEESEIDLEWVNSSNAKIKTVIYRFNNLNNDANNGIVSGIKYYPVKKITKLYPFSKLNSSLTISGVEGKLLDAGSNLMTGGSLGSSTTVGDLVNSVKLLNNAEKTPINMLMDGGFTTPAYAIAIKEVCESLGISHGYLSCDFSAEKSVDYLTAIVDYKKSTNLNTELCSMFTGWIQIFDEYNQIDVWVSPEGFAAASQSFTTRNYNMFTPAAGWKNGKLDGLDVSVKFSTGDRDFLVDNNLNPIRYKEGSGLVIWGNETMLAKPSPLQLRSVAMLLIVIKTGVDGILEFMNFDLNNDNSWGSVEGTLNAFMRDEIKAKGGVYDYSVAVKEVITESDLDARKMPVFIGIQPTSDIQEIPVTLAIFNSTTEISVSL